MCVCACVCCVCVRMLLQLARKKYISTSLKKKEIADLTLVYKIKAHVYYQALEEIQEGAKLW